MFPCSAGIFKEDWKSPDLDQGAGRESTETAATAIRSPSAFDLYQQKPVLFARTIALQNVHAREFKLRLGFSSYDEQVTRNWHRQ